MKKIFAILIFVFVMLATVFTQSQELNTIIETLVRPENLNSYFDHQIVFYQNSYKELKVQIEEMIDDEKSIKKRIQSKRKIRRRDQEKLDEVNERLALLKEDLAFTEKFISIWRSYERFESKTRNGFYESYNADTCYVLETEDEKLEPYEYEIKWEEIKQEIEWQELVEGIEHCKKGDRIEISPPSTKWVKRKADRNCISEDPNDCLVWCLIEVPAEYGIAEDHMVLKCPNGFQISSDKKYCYRTISIINEQESTMRLVIKDKDFPNREIKIKNYTITDCKN